MTELEEKFINSTLHLAESQELKEQIEKELTVPDPETLEAAESVLKFKELENET